MIAPQGLFEDLGLKYVGPVDGHDVEAIEAALTAAARLRRPGDRALHHREGPRATRRRSSTMLDRFHAGRRRAGAGQAGRRPQLDLDLQRGAGRGRRRAARRGGDHRGDAGADRAGRVRPGVPGPGVRRGHRRAARGHLGRRAGPGRAAPGGRDLRDLPQPGLRPGADGRRPAPAGGHLRAGPGRGHRQRRTEPQRHVGPVDPAGGARAADRRARATATGCASCSGRRSRSPTARPWSGSPRARRRCRCRRSTRSAAWTCCTAPPASTIPRCCSSRSARWRGAAWAPRRC